MRISRACADKINGGGSKPPEVFHRSWTDDGGWVNWSDRELKFGKLDTVGASCLGKTKGHFMDNKFNREVHESLLIKHLGGTRILENKVNPIASGRSGPQVRN